MNEWSSARYCYVTDNTKPVCRLCATSCATAALCFSFYLYPIIVTDSLFNVHCFHLSTRCRYILRYGDVGISCLCSSSLVTLLHHQNVTKERIFCPLLNIIEMSSNSHWQQCAISHELIYSKYWLQYSGQPYRGKCCFKCSHLQ